MLLVVAGGGFVASKLLAVAVTHYSVADSAADLNYDLGQLTEVSNQIADTTQPSGDLLARADMVGHRLTNDLAILEHSGYEHADVEHLASNIGLFVASLDRMRLLARQGQGNKAAALSARLDPTYQGLTDQINVEMDQLRSLADSTEHKVEFGAVGLGALVLGMLGVASVWDGRRRRLSATADAERRSQARYEAMVERSWDLLVLTDVQGRLIYASPALTSILGYDAHAVAEAYLSDVVDPGEASQIVELSERALSLGSAGPADCRIRHADGSWRTMEVMVVDLTAVPDVAGVLWSARDVTERRALERELEKKVFTDALTGLANRSLLRDRLEQAVARDMRGGRPFAVLLADLDGFKAVNDSLGHDVGDEVLVEVAARLSACRRAGDTVARLGGDEFAILLDDVSDPGVAEEFAVRVLDLFRQPFAVAGTELRIGISIGIADDRAGGETAQELLRNADIAMYNAKSQGRGRFVAFKGIMHTQAQEHLTLSADLEVALERDQFEVYYQPTIALATMDVTGAEALLRWRHPTRGMLPPGTFISLAEQSGLIVPVGRWVLEQACRQSQAWQKQFPTSPPRTMSVNLSGRQLSDPQIVDDVSTIVTNCGIDPTTVILEITESVLMDDVEMVKEKLHRLKDLGVRLAIDDFGTGYSSLAYLRQFPVDILKIDRSFVEAASVGASGGEALVRAIVDLGTSLHLAMVAEGIEEQSQADHMLAIGCPTGQGFLFAHPMPGGELSKVLATEAGLHRVA